MKNLITVVGLSIMAVAGAAFAASRVASHQATEQQVQAAIDGRLHEMLRELNARHH